MKTNNRMTFVFFLLAAAGVSPLAHAQPATGSSPGPAMQENSPEALYQAARDLLKSKAGDESAKKGFQMMLEAAEKGHVLAMAGVAYLFNVGMGTPKDNAVAAKWFRLAAEKGHAVSQYNLGKLLVADEIPLPDGVVDRKTQHEEGVAWMRQAADQGLNNARATYGVMLLKGDFGTKADAAAAAGYLQPAVDAGNLDAMNALGLMYRTGNGVALDPGEAERLFRRAAMAGHVKAQANLGDLLNPSSQNPDQRTEALAWLFIAEEAKDIVAKKILVIKLQVTSPEDVAVAKKKAAEIKQTIKPETK